MRIYRNLAALATVVVMGGCQSMPPIETVANVDLKRFMGDWYVIANIPTYFEKDAYNAVESYQLKPDGSIQTTFRYNKGSFEGPLKTYRPRAFVQDASTNAHWGMQFVWPFRAEYRIVYLDEDYRLTVIGRTKRDYLWIMARSPQISEEEYEKVLSLVADLGYDASKVKRVPQQTGTGQG